MDQQQHDGQQKQSGGGLWAAGVFFVALVFLFIMLGGYVRGWEWSGLPKRTLWDWLELLIVPTAVAVGIFLLDRSQRQREQASDRAQRERE